MTEKKAGCSVTSLNTTDKADILRQEFRDNTNVQYYIRLGSLLEWIENNIIPKLKFNDKTPPILKFDYDTESNLIYALGSGYSFSSNLNSCLIKSTVILDNQTYIIAPNAERFLDVVKNKATNTDSEYQAGKLMNIYLNFNFLLTSLTNNINKDDGKAYLIKFLQGICSEINSSLGNVNMLNVTVDEPSNKVVIIDQNSIPNRDKIIKSVSPFSNTEIAKFELFGYKNLNTTSSIGTFVQNFSLKTGITPAFASMINIGATSQGYVVGEEATILSRINRGLKDRVKPEIVNADYSTTNVTSSLESTKAKFEENAISLAEYIKMIFSPGPSTLPVLAQDLISDIQNTLRNTIETGEAYNAISASISNPNVASNRSGFIPFNLSLTIDGLSGMKVYQKFTVNNDYLPSNYPESLEFIVTSINHVIQDNKWITQIESLSLPKTTTQAKLSSTLPPLNNPELRVLSVASALNTDSFNKRNEIQTAIQYFKGKGLTAPQVAGIIGNLLLESGLEPLRVNSIGAIGIAQWLGDRKTKLLRNPNYTKYLTQLAFIWVELSSTEKNALKELKKQTTSQGAAYTFDKYYERSGSSGVPKRIGYANDILNKINSGIYVW